VLAGTLATVIFSLSEMADEANRIEATLTSRSATAAIQSFVRRLGESHEDYARWDDAVRSLYGPVDRDFVDQNYVASTATPTFFDTAYLLDEKGSEVFAYRNGEAVSDGWREAFGPVLAAMIARLPSDGSTYADESGIVRTRWGLAAVSVGPVVPNTAGFPRRPPDREC
jgi:sensor domain CHASE-containing protein